MKKSITIITIAAIIVSSLFSGNWNAAKAADILQTGIYRIVSGNDPNHCIDIYGFGMGNGSKVQLYTTKTGNYNSIANQLFYVTRRSDGSYNIMCVYSGQYLHISDEHYAVCPIHTWEGCDHPNSWWNLTRDGNTDYWFVENCGNGSYMDNSNAAVADENPIISYYFNGTDAQRWKFVRVDFGGNPLGWLDEAVIKDGYVFVKGWAFDWDNTDTKLTVYIQVSSKWYCITADRNRSDVNAVYNGSGNYHGFEALLNVGDMEGDQEVTAYAVNIGDGNDVMLNGGPKRVSFPKKTSETSHVYYKVNTPSGLYVRSGPNTSYKKLGALPNKTIIEVISIDGGWGKIKYGSGTGFVCADYIEYYYSDNGKSSADSAIMKYIESVKGSAAKEWGGGSGTQCVELPKHYIEQVFGCKCKNLGLGNGNTLYSGIAGQFPDKFTAIKYYEGFVPKVGDIISLYGSQKQYGHAAIVISVNNNSYIIAEQWKGSGTVQTRELTITGSSSSKNGIIGVARPK